MGGRPAGRPYDVLTQPSASMLTNFKYDTADLREQDREHIIHPWIDLGTAKTREPMVIAESRGRPYLRFRRPQDARRDRRHVVRQYRPCPRGDGAGDRRPGAAALLLLALRPHFDAALDRVRRQADGIRAGRSQARVLHHRRLDRRRFGAPLRAVLFQLHRPAAEEAHHHPRIRLSRQHLSVGLGVGQAGRPRPSRLHDRHDPSPAVAQPLPAAGRHVGGGVRRRQGQGPGRQDPGIGAGEGGLLHRRAAAGLRRRHRAAHGLSEGDAGDLPEIRRALHLRRGRDRLRAARRDLRVGAGVRHRARYHHLREGADLRLHSARRLPAVGPALRARHRRGRQGQVLPQRLHLLGPSRWPAPPG